MAWSWASQGQASGKNRGGTPRGERAALSPPPHPTMRPQRQCACRRSPPFVGRHFSWHDLAKLGRRCAARTI